jgi:hypothetical protein
MPPTTAAGVEIISMTPAHAIAIWNEFLIQIWRTGTSLDAALKVRAAAHQLSASQTGSVATLVVVEPQAAMPDSDARAQLAGMIDDQQGRMICAALVHEGQGFRAAAVRAVMTGLMALTRQPVPHQVRATVEQACAWFGTERRLNADHVLQLARVVEELRGRIPRSS